MKKSIKLSVFLILVLVMAISVFGCARKTPGKTVNPGKQTEQKKPSEEESKPSEEDNKPSIENRDATVNINLNGMRAEGLQYIDNGILGTPDSTGNKITVRVPNERFKNSPYTLINLKTESGAVFYSETTQKQVTHTGYTGETTINKAGETYEVTAMYTEESETIYRGMYPQTKATSSEIEGTTITEEVANNEPKTGYGKFSYTIAYNKGNKFEVINGNYYKFEPVEWETFPADTSKQWTKNTLDISVFDNGQGGSNQYDTSYIKGYLGVMAQKMQITETLSLPKIGGNDELPWETAQTYFNTDDKKAKLKYKKVTDYAGAVAGSYKALRNIPFNIGGTISTWTWLGTCFQGYFTRSSYINNDGSIFHAYTRTAYGLRVAK